MNIIGDIFFYFYFTAMSAWAILLFWKIIVATLLEVFNIHEYEATVNKTTYGYNIKFFNIDSGKGYIVPSKKWFVGWKKYKLWTIRIYKRKNIIVKDIVTDEPYYSSILESIILKKIIPIKNLKEYYFLIRY